MGGDGGGGDGAAATGGTGVGNRKPGVAGTANTGGGAGGGSFYYGEGATGGSGVVILRYPSGNSISQSGLTLSTATVGNDKVTTITAGTGTVTFS